MKKIIKKGLNLMGLDIKRLQPVKDSWDWVQLYNINTIIDIGANTGQFALEIRKKLPEAKLYSFEPVTKCYHELNKNMERDENFRSFNLALGDKNENKDINLSSYLPSSSILEMSELHKTVFPHTKDLAGKETITVARLDDIFNRIDRPDNILVKIDVQGYEDKVIRGGLESLPQAKAVTLETSFSTLYNNQPLFEEIYSLLNKLGFSYAGSNCRKKNPFNGMVLFEDSIFIKKN